MSLRLRLFLLLVLTNTLIFIVVQFATFRWHRNELESQRAVAEEIVRESFGRRAGPLFSASVGENTARARVRSVLPLDSALRTLVDDVQLAVVENETVVLRLNPLGAVDRSRARNEEIETAVASMIRLRRGVASGGGYWTPIFREGAVAGGVWFSFRLPLPVEPSTSGYAWFAVILTLACAVAIDLILFAGVVVPLRGLGESAQRIGEGVTEVEIPRVRSPELQVFTDAFEAMAGRVRGHREELEREIRAAVEEVQRHERALQQSGRLASMGTLAAGIAHEINNPIGGMLNAVRLLERRDDLDAREERYLSLIRSGLERIARTARRVLDASPRGDQALPFSVSLAVERAFALAEHRIRDQRVDVTMEVDVGLPQPIGDKHEFEQVILNLVLNSLDVMQGQDDARIEVEVRHFRRGGESDGNVDVGVEVSVRDNGPGLAKEKLPQITDPFFSAKGRPDASGLGLFISSSLIRDMGGSLSFESDEGEGFLARIVLPAGGAARDSGTGTPSRSAD